MSARKRYEAPSVRDVPSEPVDAARALVVSETLDDFLKQGARESAIRRALSAACPDLPFGIVYGLAREAVRLELEQHGVRR